MSVELGKWFYEILMLDEVWELFCNLDDCILLEEYFDYVLIMKEEFVSYMVCVVCVLDFIVENVCFCEVFVLFVVEVDEYDGIFVIFLVEVLIVWLCVVCVVYKGGVV